jgi:hypothetical protein
MPVTNQTLLNLDVLETIRQAPGSLPSQVMEILCRERGISEGDAEKSLTHLLFEGAIILTADRQLVLASKPNRVKVPSHLSPSAAYIYELLSDQHTSMVVADRRKGKTTALIAYMNHRMKQGITCLLVGTDHVERCDTFANARSEAHRTAITQVTADALWDFCSVDYVRTKYSPGMEIYLEEFALFSPNQWDALFRFNTNDIRGGVTSLPPITGQPLSKLREFREWK